MIDFSTVKGLVIPEGNVAKIEDAQGNVLWSADDGLCTLTIIVEDHTYAEISIDGVYYTSSQTIKVSAGTVVKCYIEGDKGGSGYLYVNDVRKLKATDTSKSYNYVVTSDATFRIIQNNDDGGEIYITEE